jgi:hypothetical protein
MPDTVVLAHGEAVKRFVYQPSTDIGQAIQRGRLAAQRILSGGNLSDWLDIATALNHGSKLAEAEAGQANGKGYYQAYARWLDANPEFRAVKGPERAAAIWALKSENWPAVDHYLKSLAPEEYAHMTMRKVKQKIGPKPKPHSESPTSWLLSTYKDKNRDLEGKLADAMERLPASEIDWRHDPVNQIAKSLARILNADRLSALIAALIAERDSFDRAA